MRWLGERWRWYRGLSGRNQWLVGGLAVLMLLIIIGAASGGSDGAEEAVAPTPTGVAALAVAVDTTTPPPAASIATAPSAPTPAPDTATAAAAVQAAAPPPPPNPPPPPAPPRLESTAPLVPGERIKVAGVIITLNAVVDPWVSPNQFIRAQPGQRYVAIDVTLTNDSDRPYTYNTLFDWTAQDAEAFSYSASPFVGDPFLGTGTLTARGEQARGWLGFPLPSGAVLRRVTFKTLTSTNHGRFEVC